MILLSRECEGIWQMITPHVQLLQARITQWNQCWNPYLLQQRFSSLISIWFEDVKITAEWTHNSAVQLILLTHWGRVTHICVGTLTIIGSDNSLSPGRRQAIIWTNAGILLIRPLGTNFGEIVIEILSFSFKKMRLKMSSAKCCSFRLGLNVLIKAHGQETCCHNGVWVPSQYKDGLSRYGISITKIRR